MSYIESIIPKTTEKPHTETLSVNDCESSLWLNILQFEHAEPVIKIHFTTKCHDGSHRVPLNKLPKEAAVLFPGLSKEGPYVYPDFSGTKDGLPLIINLNQYPAIATTYYGNLIKAYFKELADAMVTNFPGDTQFWFQDQLQSTNDNRVYKKFTLHVQNDWETKGPELLISFDGQTVVSARSLKDIMVDGEFDTRHFGKILFRKKLYKFDHLPPMATYHPEEAYPIINCQFLAAFESGRPFLQPRQKHANTIHEIKSFYKQYIDSDTFKKIIPHNNIWKAIGIDHIRKIRTNGNQLVFGEGNVDTDIQTGLKKWGPAGLSPHKQIIYFFIYAKRDKEQARKLYDHICKKKGFLHLREFTRLPLFYSKEHNIVFENEENPLEEIKNHISNLSFDPSCRYFAFYVSPWTKYEADNAKRMVYFKLKELLLRRHILMQTIEKYKLENGNVPYFMSNIGVAMIAKLGGIPWRLQQPVEDELIIGFGAFRSQKYNTRYVGSAFCFSNDGTFEEFDCFPAEDTYLIAGTIEAALLRYRSKHQDVKRMIIHFYKKISEKELRPIENMLRKLKLDIPVIIVSINKTPSENLLAFTDDTNCTMPTNGTYTRVGSRQYLLHINDRHSTIQTTPTAMPLPLKIRIDANQKSLCDDPQLTDRVMKQLYGFCFMHWRSVRHSSLPVTVAYPEMLASIFPWFDDEVLPDEGCKTPWFL